MVYNKQQDLVSHTITMKRPESLDFEIEKSFRVDTPSQHTFKTPSLLPPTPLPPNTHSPPPPFLPLPLSIFLFIIFFFLIIIIFPFPSHLFLLRLIITISSSSVSSLPPFHSPLPIPVFLSSSSPSLFPLLSPPPAPPPTQNIMIASETRNPCKPHLPHGPASEEVSSWSWSSSAGVLSRGNGWRQLATATSGLRRERTIRDSALAKG